MLALASFDHVTLVVDDLPRVAAWYAAVLGFHAATRPAALESLAAGEWLEHPAIAIKLHLIAGAPPARRGADITPCAPHVSFTAAGPLAAAEAALAAAGVRYARHVLVEGGVAVTQLFVHDPSGNMVEICDCDALAAPRRAAAPSAAPSGSGPPSDVSESARVSMDCARSPRRPTPP